jgi:hypothetical protein
MSLNVNRYSRAKEFDDQLNLGNSGVDEVEWLFFLEGFQTLFHF